MNFDHSMEMEVDPDLTPALVAGFRSAMEIVERDKKGGVTATLPNRYIGRIKYNLRVLDWLGLAEVTHNEKGVPHWRSTQAYRDLLPRRDKPNDLTS